MTGAECTSLTQCLAAALAANPAPGRTFLPGHMPLAVKAPNTAAGDWDLGPVLSAAASQDTSAATSIGNNGQLLMRSVEIFCNQIIKSFKLWEGLGRGNHEQLHTAIKQGKHIPLWVKPSLLLSTDTCCRNFSGMELQLFSLQATEHFLIISFVEWFRNISLILHQFAILNLNCIELLVTASIPHPTRNYAL